MIHSYTNEILRGYAISEHKDPGILIAEKQILLPQKDIIMQDQCQDMAWDNTRIIIGDSISLLKGGRKL